MWVAAREANDFDAYAPALEENFRLAREYLSCFDNYEQPYDVVLEDFAPRNMTQRRGERVCSERCATSCCR